MADKSHFSIEVVLRIIVAFSVPFAMMTQGIATNDHAVFAAGWFWIGLMITVAIGCLVSGEKGLWYFLLGVAALAGIVWLLGV